jgi:hypothetical protein
MKLTASARLVDRPLHADTHDARNDVWSVAWVKSFAPSDTTLLINPTIASSSSLSLKNQIASTATHSTSLSPCASAIPTSPSALSQSWELTASWNDRQSSTRSTQEVGVRHGAGAGLPNPRACRLHLRGSQHLARLLHREARRGQRRVRLPLGRRRHRRRRERHEAVEVDPWERDADPEVSDPVGQGHEAVGRHGGAERRLLLQEPPEPERRRRSTARRQGGGAEQWPGVWGFDLGGGSISTRGVGRRGGGSRRVGEGVAGGRTWACGGGGGVDLRKRADGADSSKAEPGEAAYPL